MDFRFKFMEQIVGAFLVVTVIVFIAAVVLVGRGQDWFEDKYTFYIFLAQGYGLKPSSPVKMLNSEIGKVKSMGMDKESRMVVVKIQILKKDADTIREDSEAAIESEGLIGGTYISISPGSDEYAALKDGSIIKALPKKTIGDYLKELEPEKKIQTITDIINDLSEITNRLKNPNEGILAALDNINVITETIRMGEGNIGKLLMEEDLYRQLDKELNEISAIVQNLKSSTDDVSLTTEKMPALLDEINAGVKQIRSVIENVEKGTRDIPEMSRKAKDGVDSAVEIVDSIKENPLVKIGTPKTEPPDRTVEIQIKGE